MMRFTVKDIQRYVKINNQRLLSDGYLQRLVLARCKAGGKTLLSFYRISLTADEQGNTRKIKLSRELSIQGAVDWLESFYPPEHGFIMEEQAPPVFINGFESWQETFFEIVCVLQQSTMRRGSVSYQRHEAEGTVGLYALAKEMTDEFEAMQAGRIWNGDFSDAIATFSQVRNL